MIPRRAWLVAIFVAVLTTVALRGGRGRESAFCSGLRDVDVAVSALPGVKVDFDSAPRLFDDIADAFDGIEPPPQLRRDWTIIVERFHDYAEVARNLLSDTRSPTDSRADAARFVEAWTNFGDYAIDECGRVTGGPLLG